MKLADVESVEEVERAGVLLHPMRMEILERARRPRSATEIAGELGLARQKVNYHVQALHRSAFLRRAGRRKKRNLVEQRWVASARSYVLAPDLLGSLGARAGLVEDPLSAAFLLATLSRAQGDLGRVLRAAQAEEKRVPTLTLSTELRFTSPQQREAFATELQEALQEVVRRHSSPARRTDGTPAEGRPYRLALGCYPAPREETEDPS